MQVHFVRSGGFAGLLVDVQVDSAELPAEQAAALEQAVESAAFFTLPERIFAEPGGVDRFQYEITVKSAQKEHTVQTGEASMPEALRPLVQQLEVLWRTRR